LIVNGSVGSDGSYDIDGSDGSVGYYDIDGYDGCSFKFSFFNRAYEAKNLIKHPNNLLTTQVT
jgi:hypothetical protein